MQFLYEGKDSELIAEISDGKAAHAGGIYGVSWSPGGKQLLSASNTNIHESEQQNDDLERAKRNTLT